jgi:integrase
VPIYLALEMVLRAYKPDGRSGKCFLSPQKCRYNENNASRHLSEIQKAVDKEKGWKKLPWMWLDFRHTFGSQLAQKGESLYKVSKLMGNSPEICRRHYAALIPEEMRDTVEFDHPQNPKKPIATISNFREA